ncbi:MAG: flagellar assembly lytic transglycosylase [Spirochaeta sp.]
MYLRTIQHISLRGITAVIFALLISGCSSAAASPLPPEALVQQILDGKLATEDVLTGPSGSAYMLGRYLQSFPAEELQPDTFFMLSLRHEDAPFAVEAGLQLLQTSASGDAASEAALRLKERFSDTYEVSRALAKHWYEQEADGKLAAHLPELNEFPQSRNDAEVRLWNIMLPIRSNSSVPRDELEAFLTDFRAADEHWRLERYIAFHDDLVIEPELYELLQHKAAVSQQQYRGSAAALLEESWPAVNALLLWDIYTAAGQSGTEAELAGAFLDIAHGADGVPSSAASFIGNPLPAELAGRLLAKIGRNSAAIEAFRLGIDLLVTDNPEAIAELSGQRMVWNWWQAGIRTGLDTGLAQAEMLQGWIRNPDYFDDLVHDLISRLVREERWGAMQQLYAQLDGVLSQGVLARLAWIMAEGIRTGADLALDRERLLQQAADQRENPYYSMVASIMLGRPRELPVLDDRQGPEPSLIGYSAGEYRQWAYLAYESKVLDEGYRILYAGAAWFEMDEIARFAEQHHQEGRYIDGMRLLDRAIRIHQPESIPEKLMELRYPLAFSSEIHEVLERYEHYPPVFYALVREESYFDAGIRSWVGASGLMQLMPATANDMAQLLRMEEPDLTDPDTNLAIGGLYYHRLLNRFKIPVQALIAYNAGQGRVNRWRTESWAESSILFHEGLPFEETRHYIRKIFVSAAHYNALHFSGSANEVFSFLFPDADAYTDNQFRR